METTTIRTTNGGGARRAAVNALAIATNPEQIRFNQFILSNDRIGAQLLLIERKFDRALA